MHSPDLLFLLCSFFGVTLIDVISWAAIENEEIVKSVSLTKPTQRVRYFFVYLLVVENKKDTKGKHITNDLAVIKCLYYLVQPTFLIFYLKYILLFFYREEGRGTES